MGRQSTRPCSNLCKWNIILAAEPHWVIAASQQHQDAVVFQNCVTGYVCYRAALGEYELGLAYMVIAASQRDPGEYMLQLQVGSCALLRQMQSLSHDFVSGCYHQPLVMLAVASATSDRFDPAAPRM